MTTTVNSQYRKRLPGTALDYFDAREAVEAIQAGAWDKLPTPPACWPSSWCAAASPPT